MRAQIHTHIHRHTQALLDPDERAQLLGCLGVVECWNCARWLPSSVVQAMHLCRKLAVRVVSEEGGWGVGGKRESTCRVTRGEAEGGRDKRGRGRLPLGEVWELTHTDTNAHSYSDAA